MLSRLILPHSGQGRDQVGCEPRLPRPQRSGNLCAEREPPGHCMRLMVSCLRN